MKAVHFVLRGVSYDDAIDHILRSSANFGFDTIIVMIADGLNYGGLKTSRGDAWSQQEMLSFIGEASIRGIRVIPEIKLLTHQEYFLKIIYPEYMLDKSTYDPYSGVYDLVTPYIDSILSLFGEGYLHIGHDEVNNWQKESEMALDAYGYRRHLMMINNHVRRYHPSTKVMMWGDMLASPDEFPGMSPQHFHGLYNGFGAEIRKKIPNDIIVCDWRYVGNETEFPIANALISDGSSDVIGCTWKANGPIANYPKYLANNGGKGMIATTWFHVQRQEWDMVSEILSKSANSFNRYF